MRKKFILVLAALGLSLTGCEPSAEERAGDFFRALSTATNIAKIRVQTMYPGQGTHAVDLVADCMHGGTQHLLGTLVRDEGVQESYAMTLTECTVDSIIMTGTVDYTLDADGDIGVTNYAGTVDLGGDLDGSCDLDFTLTATQGPTGCTVTYSGTICGIAGLEPLGPDCL